jgi:phage tail sheath protein FI
LKLVWRSGALFGATPEEAFYVLCNEGLNPPEVRDQGVLVVEVGLAAVKPAEYVVLQFRQWAGPNAQA